MDLYGGETNSVLDLVASFPSAAAQKNRERWLSFFSPDAWIEDPAGALRFHATDPEWGLEKFYDIFIAATDISLEVEEDYVSGNQVVRDGVIHVNVKGEGAIQVPIFLRYRISDNSYISELRAYWELLPAMAKAVGSGPGGAGYLVTLGRRLVRATGFQGALGFLSTAEPASFIGKSTIRRLKEYLETGRYYEATMLFSRFEGNELLFHRPDGSQSQPPSYLTMGDLKIREIDKLIGGGRHLGFRFVVELEGDESAGVGFLTLSGTGLKIQRAEFFFV